MRDTRFFMHFLAQSYGGTTSATLQLFVMFPSIRAENRQMKEEEAEGSLYRTSCSAVSNPDHQLDLLPDLLQYI